MQTCTRDGLRPAKEGETRYVIKTVLNANIYLSLFLMHMWLTVRASTVRTVRQAICCSTDRAFELGLGR